MSTSYAAAARLVRVLVRAFFRRIEVVGSDNVPPSGGGLLIAWHPNGLIDPALILSRMPRRVAFGARHGLFRVPVVGALLRAVGAVPIFRAADAAGSAEERRRQNQLSLAALARAISDGDFAALFPEGVSHDAPHLMELRTGAARLYYEARRATAPGKPLPVIVPVGLHYDDKRAFRSSALVTFEAPLRLPAHLDVTPEAGESDDVERERARQLTAELERALTEVIHATESWELHHRMHRARKLVRAERGRRAGKRLERPDMAERALGFARVWAGYYQRRRSHPDEVATLEARLASYDADLRALALEDHELDADPRLGSLWLPALLALQVVTVYLLLPPILLVGYLVNVPVALLLVGVSRLVSNAYKDEATVKVLLGALLFPVVWVGAGIVAARAHIELRASIPALPDVPVLTGVVFALVAALGGAVALRYLRVARETARAVRIRLFRPWRKRATVRLLAERAALYEAITGFAEGLELPGQVGDDGRVVRGADG